MKVNENYGLAITKARERLNEKPGIMAIKLGMSRVQLADLEKSLHAPNATTIARLCTGLPGLKISDFFVDEQPKKGR